MVFNITPSNFEENLDKKSFNHPRDYVVENAKQKALEVMQRLEKVRAFGKTLEKSLLSFHYRKQFLVQWRTLFTHFRFLYHLCIVLNYRSLY